MLWFRNRPIRQKLLLTILVASGSAVILAGMTILIWDQVLFRQRLQADLSSVADIMAENTTAALSFEDPKSASQTLGALKAKPHVVCACVFRPNGTILARYDRSATQPECPAPGQSDAASFGERGLEITRRITLDGKRIGTLTLLYDLSEIRERLWRDAASMVGVLLLSILAAFVLSTRFRRAITEPIIELANITRTVAETRDYGLRASHRSEEELGDLVDAFNNMLKTIQTQNSELREARDSLEERVKRRTEELRRSEEHFRLLVTTVLDYAIYMLDPQGRVASWNSGAERLKGYRAEEILGRSFATFYLPEDQDKPGRLLKIASRQGRADDEGWRVRKDGSRFWAGAVITALYDDAGNLIGFSKVVHDLTEHKKAEEALRRQAADLARSNADLQQFAYVASHDLQEPLRMVTSYMQIIADQYRGKLDADADECIGFAVDGAQRMRQLITGLLAYSRVGTRGQQLSLTDCSAVLSEVIANLNVAIHESAAIIECESLPTVMIDAAQMAQLFQNLIANALTFHGNAIPRIRVSAQRNGAGWKFSVEDNGIGIAPEHYERIFVIFQRLHDRIKYKGTGIGLAICKKIVERRGGKIWVTSERGRGSTFYFTIPDNPPDVEI
jgi:PAS domain S-box-containing protein